MAGMSLEHSWHLYGVSDPAGESGWGVPAGEGGGRGLQEERQGGDVSQGQGGR